MTILRLKKITLCGLLREKRGLLEGLQDLGCMHLLPLRPRPAEVEKVASPRAEAAFKALRFLSDMPQKRRQVLRDPRFDVGSLITDALALKQGLRDATDRRDFLEHRIAAVEPWGDLVFPPHEALVGYRLWFYVLPLALLSTLDSVELPWQILRKDHRFVYLVVIAKEEPPGDLLPVPRTHTGALPLGELKAQLEDTEIELEDLVAQRQALTRYIYLLSVNLAEAENQASLSYAEQQTRDGDSLVAVQGWVPVDSLATVEAYVREAGLACLIEEPGAQDDPPTLIEQPDELAAGADLAVFYQVPGYRSWDPTLLLVAFFSLFFAMILADAGYGAVLMAGLLLFWRRLGRSRTSRSYRTLGLSLFGCTILYGVIVGSYFGVTPPPDSLPGTLHVLSVNDFDSMMKLSIVVGVLHIVFANAMAAYVRCRSLVALSKLGWITGIFGGLAFWLAGTDASWTLAGQALIGIGLLAVLLFSSERPVRKPSDYLWRLADGMKSLTGVMGAFGDVLSYMRLFALGLASASLAVTFNDLATSVHQASPGIGLLAAILILAIGHSLNLGLSLMSGVVHGLRLNFIEFYKWGLPEEGTAFRRFARKEVQP
ncbi:V-type ATP synthase subunit I [Pelagibius litoralis]|uniref:V-type ATP synthase subunit I n=1 Tax=Pelagibius litoralis TaxID=374515 RepID=A0A967F1I4_9PROT|nr:V-type ATP synthase subunit I [Pelagibius litoralis]NIA71347.1 V-type ATP synthase subunit I [Pelagibius litoralis]